MGDRELYEMLRLNTLLVAKMAAAIGVGGYFTLQEMQSLRDHVAKSIDQLPLDRTGDFYEIDAALEDGMAVMREDGAD